jgi:hypothetical protein
MPEMRKRSENLKKCIEFFGKNGIYNAIIHRK